MSAPLIEAADCTESGNNTADTSWVVSCPAQSTGDLILIHLAADGSTALSSLTPPTGRNGETLSVLKALTGFATGSSITRGYLAAYYYVATGSAAAGSITFTASNQEQFQATVARVPAGEFDGTTPIGASAFADIDPASSSISTPAFSAGSSDGGGRLCAWIAVNTDPITGTPSGWTDRTSTDVGAVSGTFSTRDAETTNSESIAAATWTVASDTAGTFAYIVRGPGGSTYNVDIAETASASDSLSSAATLAATIAEAASAADTCSSIATLAATIAEAISAADSVSAGAATYAVDIAEAASLADAISSVLTAAAAVAESASAADTVSSVATLIADLAESVTATDLVSTGGSTYAVDVAEAIAALDTFSAQFDLAGAIAEAVNASDSTASLAALAAAVAEAIAAADSATAAGIFGVTITESANAADSVSAPTGFGETPASRTITVQRGGRTITVQLHGRTITVH